MPEGRSPVNPVLTAIYLPPALQAIPRLLSQIDREPGSLTWGNVDREHWAWKFRDFPMGMQQTAIYPLALVWSLPHPDNPYFASPRLFDWLLAIIQNTLDRQHSNGALDAFAPNEQDIGSTLGMMYGLAEAFRLIRPNIPQALNSRFMESFHRACDFSLRRDEMHGFVSNHRAYIALAFLDAYELFKDQRYLNRAEWYIESILQMQSKEGWYLEYEGPDPGYESLGIFHLANYWKRTASSRLLDSLRRSITFYSYCFHPDGSVGGVYGSRQTSQYFPGGFEMLAGEIPLAAEIARFMRRRILHNNVLTPLTSDFENLVPLLYNYLSSCQGSDQVDFDGEGLPCANLAGVHHFPDSKISFAGTRRYYAVINSSKGGVCRVFDKFEGRLVYEDAGYLVKTGKRRWVSQKNLLGQAQLTNDAREVICNARLAEYVQMIPSPVNFALLRVLNLTFFRFPALASWIRHVVVHRMITSKKVGPFTLKRRVIFDEDQITFIDELWREGTLHVEEVNLPRELTSIHMASAKYYQMSDLHETPVAQVEDMADQLNQTGKAQHTFSLHFSPGNSVELT